MVICLFPHNAFSYYLLSFIANNLSEQKYVLTWYNLILKMIILKTNLNYCNIKLENSHLAQRLFNWKFENSCCKSNNIGFLVNLKWSSSGWCHVGCRWILLLQRLMRIEMSIFCRWHKCFWSVWTVLLKVCTCAQ